MQDAKDVQSLLVQTHFQIIANRSQARTTAREQIAHRLHSRTLACRSCSCLNPSPTFLPALPRAFRLAKHAGARNGKKGGLRVVHRHRMTTRKRTEERRSKKSSYRCRSCPPACSVPPCPSRRHSFHSSRLEHHRPFLFCCFLLHVVTAKVNDHGLRLNILRLLCSS